MKSMTTCIVRGDTELTGFNCGASGLPTLMYNDDKYYIDCITRGQQMRPLNHHYMGHVRHGIKALAHWYRFHKKDNDVADRLYLLERAISDIQARGTEECIRYFVKQVREITEIWKQEW
jgi:hypothetical protein